MEYASFYRLSDPFGRAFRARPRADLNSSDLVRGRVLPAEPIIFEHASGGAVQDFMATEYTGVWLISTRVVNLLEDEGFTGWTTYPAVVYGKNGELLPGYSGLSVTGRCGPIDNDLSRIETRGPLSQGGLPFKVWMGMFFRADTYEGTDFFLPSGSLFLIVTKRVRDALVRAKVRNIELERLTEVERRVI